MEETDFDFLEIKYTVSPSDLKPEIESKNDSELATAGRNASILAAAAGVLFLLSRQLEALDTLLFISSGLTLISAFGCLVSAFKRREKLPSFETFDAIILASIHGVTHFTGGVRTTVDWWLVKNISTSQFGLYISFGDAVWWVPPSAFSIHDDMEKAAVTLRQLREVGLAAINGSIEDDGEFTADDPQPASKILH